jgi:hypothetical protein
VLDNKIKTGKYFVVPEDLILSGNKLRKKKKLKPGDRCPKGHLLYVGIEPTGINNDGVCAICEGGK